MHFNPLIAIPSPREIQEVKLSLSQIPYDKLWIKNHDEGEAYAAISDYFSKHLEYTHVIISPDDLVLNVDGVKKLIRDLEEHPEIKVLSGVCNIDDKDGLNVTLNEISIVRDERKYGFIKRRERSPEYHLIKVAFSGFAFQIIAREVFEKVGFHGDKLANAYNRVDRDTSFDVMFSDDCRREGIDIWVDLFAEFRHIYSPYLRVGIDAKNIYLEKGQILKP